MTKDELFKLLDALTLPEHIIDLLEAPNWRFWRKGQSLDRQQVFPLLREFIEGRTGKAEAKLRENAYFLLGRLLRDGMEPEFCQFLIDSLSRETDKYVLHTMLSGIGRLQLPVDIDVAPIIACSKSNEWLVRHSAIVALGMSNTDASRDAIRYWVKQEDEKHHKFELIYANAALGYIGEPGDIALLEQHIYSRIRDVKDSAVYAINNIKQRFGMNPLGEK